jgi:hypothetical protein
MKQLGLGTSEVKLVVLEVLSNLLLRDVPGLDLNEQGDVNEARENNNDSSTII